MSEINVTYAKHSLRRNSYPSLAQAILHAGNNDTIVIHRRKNVLGPSIKVIPINKSLYIQGASAKSKPTIYVKNHQIGLGLTQGDLHLKNVNIQLTAQAIGFETSANYTGNIVLDGVNIEHKGRIIPREYQYGFLVWGSRQAPELRANVVLNNCAIDYIDVCSLYLTAENSTLGRLDGTQSALGCGVGQFANVELTHTEVNNMSGSSKPLMLAQIATKGLLHLIGNATVKGLKFLNGIQQPNHPLGGLFQDPKKLLAQYQVPATMPMVFTDSINIQNVISSIKLSDITYDPTLLRVQPREALVRPYSFDFNNVHMTIANSKIYPNYLGPKNVTTKGSLMLEDVHDKSHWKDTNTTTGRKGDTESELFSTLPTGSEIHANVAVDPVARLNNLIGLAEPKKLIKRIIASAIVDRYNKKQNPKQAHHKVHWHMPMHTVLEGPAGTGKTTVARLIWQILYKRDVVGSNYIHIDGNDLKAQYQGQTAPRVEKFFNKAEGGVLFIDEAYGLVGGKKGGGDDFSHEAISTLTDELERHQHDVLCIMAGYTYDMQQLLDSNEGLHSRFMHIIQFPDYSVTEMIKILELMMRKKHQQAEDGSAEIELSKGLKTVLDAKKGSPGGNGNARTARNYLTAVTSARDARIVYQGGVTALKNSANRRTITASDADEGTTDMIEKIQAE